MPAGRIFLRDQNRLVPMLEEVYSAESDLQELLATYPELLAGDQMDWSEPRRWLLIRREAGIPSVEGGGDRWAVDHLFLDQDAVPTLVEVKRSTDTRLRREVVGQMLDYAANVVSYWGPEQIRSLFEAECGTPEIAAERLSQFLASSPSSADASSASAPEMFDRFWQQASDHLAARRLRLLFVADVIPPELQRVVEFLNESLERIEVLAVEVKQYTGRDWQTLVPRVIGKTAAAEAAKRTGRTQRTWDRDSLLEELGRRSPGAVAAAEKLLDWAGGRMPDIGFGRGAHVGSCFPTLLLNGVAHNLFYIRTDASVVVPFGYMAKRPPFDRVESRTELRDRLIAVGFAIGDETVSGWPAIALSAVEADESLARFLEVMDWAVDLIQQTAT